MAGKKKAKVTNEIENTKIEAFIKEVNEVQVKHGLRLVIRERDSHYIAVERMQNPKK